MKKTFGFSVFDLLHFILLVTLDSLAVYFSLWLGHYFWVISDFRVHHSPPEMEAINIIIVIFIIIAALVIGGSYRFHHSILNTMKLKDLISSIIIGYLIVLMFSFFTKSIIISRLWALYTGVIVIFAIILERSISDYLWSKFVAKGIKKRRVLIYGAGTSGKRLMKSIRRLPKMNYEVVGFIDDNKRKGYKVCPNPVYVLGGLKDLSNIVKKHTIDRLIVALPNVSIEKMKKILAVCETLKLKFKFIPGMHNQPFSHLKIEDFDGIVLFSQKDYTITRTNKFLKRSFDIIFSLIALLLFAPIMGILAILIRKDSPGPVLFRQIRIGYKGEAFIMYKFRSLYEDTPEYAVNPFDSNDSRITKIGKFLRRTSLDELPQFWNVLKGDMSVVGPRPEMPFIVKEYEESHKVRLNAKPGITGLWQISGDRGLPIHENIEHDIYYIENQSLLLDIVIILETVIFAIKGVGAR